jgi:hypothetical protein
MEMMSNGNYFIARLHSNRCLFILAKLSAKSSEEVGRPTARRNQKTKTFLGFSIATLLGGDLGRQPKCNNLIKKIKKHSRNPHNVSGSVYNRTMKKRKPPLNKIAQATRNAHSAELFKSLMLNKHLVATPAKRKGSRKANITKAIKEYN